MNNLTALEFETYFVRPVPFIEWGPDKNVVHARGNLKGDAFAGFDLGATVAIDPYLEFLLTQGNPAEG